MNNYCGTYDKEQIDTVTDQDVKFVSKSQIFKVSYGMQIKQKINQDNDEKH